MVSIRSATPLGWWWKWWKLINVRMKSRVYIVKKDVPFVFRQLSNNLLPATKRDFDCYQMKSRLLPNKISPYNSLFKRVLSNVLGVSHEFYRPQNRFYAKMGKNHLILIYFLYFCNVFNSIEIETF